MSQPDLPYNLDAEKATIGSLLLNRDAIVAVAPFLQAEHFYQTRLGLIYQAALNCYQKRIPPDTRTIADALRQMGKLDDVGGLAFLSGLVDSVPTSYHVEYYARIVERDGIKRQFIAAAGKIAAIGYRPDLDTDEVIALAQSELLAADTRKSTRHIVTIAEAASRVFDAMTRGQPPGVATGLHDYDRLTGGVHPGNLIVLGGRPGNGKSALALTIADELAANGAHVAFFSLEMTADELAQRTIAMRIGADLMAIRQHRLTEAQISDFVMAMGDIERLPLFVDDTPSLTVADIRNRALRLAAEHDGIGLVVVDYLQLVSAPERRGMNRAQAVGEVSRGLKALAKELNTPVLALAQLNREVEHRASYIPELADLRESGDIEADADQVCFIVRPELYDKDTDKKGIGELYIKKHRGGPLGLVSLQFDAKTTRYRSMSYRAEGY